MNSSAPIPQDIPQRHHAQTVLTHRAFAAALKDAIASGDKRAEDDLFYNFKLAANGMIRFRNDPASIAVCKRGRRGAIKFVHARDDSSERKRA